MDGAVSVHIAVGQAAGEVMRALAERIADGLRRQGVPVSGPSSPPEGQEQAPAAACLLLLGGGADKSASAGPGPRMAALFPAGSGQRPEEAPRVGAGTSMVVAAKPAMTEREAALFFVELFAELHAHCKGEISPAMLRFCFAKASRLAPGKAEVRA